MAEGDNSSSWPSPVHFTDKANEDFAKVHLTIPGLAVKRKYLVGDNEPKNGDVESSFSDGIILVTVSITENEKKTFYEYKKVAPEDLDPSRCKILYKEGEIVVKLAKVKATSWAMHHSYLDRRPE